MYMCVCVCLYNRHRLGGVAPAWPFWSEAGLFRAIRGPVSGANAV